MNRYHILSLSLITALGLALLPSSTVAQQKSLKEQIVGSWTYVSADTVAPMAKGSRRLVQIHQASRYLVVMAVMFR